MQPLAGTGRGHDGGARGSRNLECDKIVARYSRWATSGKGLLDIPSADQQRVRETGILIYRIDGGTVAEIGLR